MDCCKKSSASQAHQTTNNNSGNQHNMNCDAGMSCSVAGINTLLSTTHLLAYSAHVDSLNNFITNHYTSLSLDNPQRPPRIFA
jgi:hypothetical protein